MNVICHISIYFELFLAWSSNFLKIWKITAGKKDSSSIQQSSTPMNHERRQKIIKSVIRVATQCPHETDHSGIFSRDLCDFISFHDFCREMRWSRTNVHRIWSDPGVMFTKAKRFFRQYIIRWIKCLFLLLFVSFWTKMNVLLYEVDIHIKEEFFNKCFIRH